MTHTDGPEGWYNDQTGNWDSPAPSGLSAVLPYAGTSGYSGTDASEERARTRDASGKTRTVQIRVLDEVLRRGRHGITIAELRTEITDEHHGTLSGALTALHKSGQIARLKEGRRGKCSVYVYRSYVEGRETVAPKRRAERDQDLNDAVNRVREYLVGRSENSALADRPVIASSWRKNGDVYNNLRVDDLELLVKALR